MSTPYRVLARKYRPQNFDNLVGQDVLVRTLTNAFSSGRIAHAYMLTGIRGIGKTTTARIIARGLNCLGADGNGGATTSPCGVCSNCKMILDDRHVDVMEMDAASRTGVDDIREIIDTVHYAPTSARYKIYIIDEVHMLTKNAFNALLKTLEEPPAHVKFIFATTELRKIPVTIVSRCQRFDLRRLDVAELQTHLSTICGHESVAASDESLMLIATAAQGSVRDALSLLDQAIALCADGASDVSISADTVRSMLGMAEHSQTLDVLEAMFKGEIVTAMDIVRNHYSNGSDPLLVMQEMLELLHYLTRIKLAPKLAADTRYSDIEQQRALNLAGGLDMTALTRFWQMALKGLGEIKHAPHPHAALEMVIIRLAHASTLPSPAEMIRTLDKMELSTATAARIGAASVSSLDVAGHSHAPSAASSAYAPSSSHRGNLALAVKHEIEPQALALAPLVELPNPENFAHIIALFEAKREAILYSHLYRDMQMVRCESGVLELHPINHVPADFAARVGRCLGEWTGKIWKVSFSDEAGEPTVFDQSQKAKQQLRAYIESHPTIVAVKETFSGAEIIDITPTV